MTPQKTNQAYGVYGGMSMDRLNQHWQVLQQCERTGARPRVYRELLETITQLRAKIIEFDLKSS